MSDTSGLSSRTPLAFYDRDSSSWKTSQATFLSDSTSSSLTLPASGMTRRGALYALPTSAPVTSGPDFSCLPTPRVATDRASRASLVRQGHWSAPSLAQALELARGILPREYESWNKVQGWHGDLMPTPTAGDSKSSRNATGEEHWDRSSNHHSGTTLTDAMALLRTPQAQVTEPKPGIKLDGRTPADPQVGLIDQVLALLPTPAAGNPNDGESPETWQARHDRHASKEEGATRSGLPLAIAVAALLPTPMARDHKGQPLPREGGDDLNMARGRLLPTPAAWDGDRGPDYARAGREDSGGDDLVTSVAKLLPTPSAADGTGGHERRGGTRGDELLLAGLAKDVTRMLPTPQGRDGDHTRGADPERYRGSKSMGGRRVNLDDMIAATKEGRWSGESTDQPSPDMNSSSVEPPLTLWIEKED